MADNLTQAEQNALLWPIKAKGAVNRVNPLNDPTISHYYQQAMEQGRVLESSITDANNIILQKKQLLVNQIETYTHMNQLAVDGQLGHHARVPKYIADGISIIQTANKFQQEILGLVMAVTTNLNTLLAIEQSMVQMVQSSLNALANLLNNICNWGLPALPSIPNLLPEGMWNWNGFNFAPLANFAKAFTKPPVFNFNFSFSQCSLTIPGLNGSGVLGPSIPQMVLTNSGLSLGTAQYIPPLGGSPSVDPTSSPVFGPDFNPNSSMDGAVPDPHTIVDAYSLPASTYTANIVSIVPSLRGDTVEPSDPDYASPNLAVRQPQLRKDLVHYINLGEIVANNYDPFIMSAWLLYLAAARAGRGGNWIPNFEAAFLAYIQPSVTYLNTVPVPYNDASGDGPEYMSIWDPTVQYQQNDVVTFGGNLYIANSGNTNLEPGANPSTWAVSPQGVVYQNAPVLPLYTLLNSLSGQKLFTLLWKLSYVEASLLGYTRNKTWDGYQDSNYLSGPTGSDLDYVPTPAGSGTTTVTLGEGTAEFPVPITFPSAYAAVMAAVIQAASVNILNDTTYQSPRLGNRYTYSPFAVASTVDRFSQFWRDFSTSLTTLLAQDPYLVQFAVTYFGTLDGAVDPLGSASAYQALQADTASRNRSRTPGTPLLPIPVAPIVTFTNSSTPTPATNGWVTIPTELDAEAFLNRPDIQGQPIPVQMAMLRTNLSYAGLQTFKNQFQGAVAAQVATANALIANAQQVGFNVDAEADTTTVAAAPAQTPVAFDQIVFDYTGNVTSPTTFTLRATGAYSGNGQLIFSTAAEGLFTVTVTQNGTPIYTNSYELDAPGMLTVPFSFTGNFTAGDIVMVEASSNLTAPLVQVLPGSLFSMILTSITPLPVIPVASAGDTIDFVVEAPPTWWTSPFPPGTVVFVQDDGTVAPIDPFVPPVTNVAESAGSVLTITAANHFSVGSLVVFRNLGAATYLNGVVTTVATLIGPGPAYTGFTAADPTLYGAYATTPETQGNAFYAVDSTGALLAPNPDGIVPVQGVAGADAPVGTTYGGQYTIRGASFTVGNPIYAGPQGALTQDYVTLINQVGWIVYVGMAQTADTMLYEPHIPTLYAP